MRAPHRFARKEVEHLARGLRRLGCAVTLTGGHHLLVTYPSGERLTLASTPRCFKTDRMKARSWLRQLGDTDVTL